MNEVIVGSNLCDEGDVVMIGSSLTRPNFRKWKRLIRGSPLQKLISGCPSPIHKMLLARHNTRRGRKPVKRALSQKFSDTNAGISSSEMIVLDPRGKRKGKEFCLILWGIWFERNVVIHSKNPSLNADLVSWSLSLLSEFQGTQKVFGFPSQPPGQPCSDPWLPPLAGSLKLNTDAAVKSGSSVLGSGAVVRDGQGKIVAASAKPLLGFFSTEIGELLALREGLLFAKDLNLVIEWVESDVVNVVARVLSSSLNSLLDPIICDVKVLFRIVRVFNCHVVPRSRNGMAHSLPSLTFSSKEDFCWFNPEPDFLVGLL
ncbi:hypothetical protein ACOSQ4_003298 [Xanthoceras sorbifolium]